MKHILLLIFTVPLFGSLADKKILFCSVGKNVEKGLPYAIESIEAIGTQCKDYRVFIYENNSSDLTPRLLSEWQNQNSKVHIESEVLDISTQKKICRAVERRGKPCRIEMIAYARNLVLKKALSEEFADFDYIIVSDLDFNWLWELDEVKNSLKTSSEWDAIFANGLSSKLMLQDRLAFRDRNFPFGPELLGEKFWDTCVLHPLYFPENAILYPVYSAFGGLGIYKRESLIGCSYSPYPDSSLETLYKEIGFNKQINWLENTGYKNCPICTDVVLSMEGEGGCCLAPWLS